MKETQEPKVTEIEKEAGFCATCGQEFEKLGNLIFHKIINEH